MKYYDKNTGDILGFIYGVLNETVWYYPLGHKTAHFLDSIEFFTLYNCK